MRIDSLITWLTSPVQLLTEANLYNLDTKYNGVSLSSFLAPYLSNVAEASRKPLQKKLARLIVNDEKYHKPVTALPDDAPDWAKTAKEQGQLVYFVPTPELEGQVEHITHYVAALEGDEKGEDANKKAVATREIAGVAKAESMALLVQKSNEYFARGSKKAAGSIEGTTHIYDGANGYSWYRLDTLDAYKREGKVLQNCIGTHWTPTKADRIYVMKASNGDTNVAVRTNAQNEIQEAKGKNNRPPVARYMPAVAELINHMKWKVTSYGMQDITAAGYVFVDGILYSKSDAIEKFLTSTPVAQGKGYTVEKLSTTTKLDPTVMRYLLGMNSYYGNKELPPAVYSYKQGPATVLTVNVDNTKTITKMSAVSPSATADKSNGPAATMLRELMKLGVVTSADSNVQDWLRKQAGIAVNFTTKEVGPIGTMKDVEGHDKPGVVTTLQGDKATQLGKIIQDWMSNSNQAPEWLENIKEAHINVLEGDFTQGYGESAQRFYPVQVGVVDKRDKVHFFTVNVSRDSHEVTIVGSGFGKRPDPAQSYNKIRDEKSINKWIEIANEKGFELPFTFRLDNGVLKTNGKYDTVHLSELRVPAAEGVQAFDVSKYEGEDRLIALSAVTRSIGTSQMSLYKQFNRLAFPLHTGEVPDKPLKVAPGAVEQFAQSAFGEQMPDKVLKTKLDVEDKDVGVLLFVSGNTIVRINDDTSEKVAARDAAEHEALAASLNKLAQENGLKFNPKTMPRHELELVGDQVVTAHSQLAKKHDEQLAKTPVKPVRFEDGTVIKRMNSRDMVDMISLSSYQGMTKDTIPQIAYEIEKDGQPIGVFTVNRHGTLQKVTGLDKKKYKGERPQPPKSKLLSRRMLPHTETRDTELMKYIAAAAPKLGYQMSSTGGSQVKADSTPARMLRVLNKETTPQPRSVITKKAGSSPAGMAGWESNNPPPDRKLYDAGLIKMEKNGRSYMLSITPKGRTALANLQPRGYLNLQHSLPQQNILPDDVEYKKPEPVATAAPTASPRAPAAVAPAGTATDLGNGSKADRAQRLWDRMVAATGVPARATFIQALINQVGMTPAGAGTYHANIKSKYMRQQGALGENFSFVDFLFLVD